MLGSDVQKNIIKYSDLANYTTINDLLPNSGDYKIILIETKKNGGHWTSIARRGNDLYYFDSYGERVDGEFRFISDVIKQLLGENRRYLTKLIKKSNMKLYENKIDYQMEGPNICTCGRYTMVWLKYFEMGHSLAQFQEFMKKTKDAYPNAPYDILIVDMSPNFV
jgi:hypothetical protein